MSVVKTGPGAGSQTYRPFTRLPLAQWRLRDFLRAMSLVNPQPVTMDKNICHGGVIKELLERAGTIQVIAQVGGSLVLGLVTKDLS